MRSHPAAVAFLAATILCGSWSAAPAAGARRIASWSSSPHFLGQQPRDIRYVEDESRLYIATMVDVFRVRPQGSAAPVLLTDPPGETWSAYGGMLDRAIPRLVPGRGDAVFLVPSGGGNVDAVTGPDPGGVFGAVAAAPAPNVIRSVRTIAVGYGRRAIVTATPLDRLEGERGRWRWEFRDAAGGIVRSYTKEGVEGVEFAPDGSAVALLESDALRIYRPHGAMRREIRGRYRSVALSEAGRVVLANPSDRPREVTVADGPNPPVGLDSGAPVHGVRISPNGRYALLWRIDGTFRSIDPVGATLGPAFRAAIPGRLFVTSLAIDDAGHALAGVIRRRARERSYRDAFLVGIDGSEIAFVEPLGRIDGTNGEPDVIAVGRDRAAVRTRGAVRLYEVDFAAPHRARPRRRTLGGSAPSRTLALIAIEPPVSESGTWPLSPVDEDHPIVATLEYMTYGGDTYIHGGIDIPAVPYCCDAAGSDLADAQYATTRIGGIVTGLRTDSTSTENHLELTPDDGTVEWYYHLASGTFNPDVVDASNESGLVVPRGTWVSKITRWLESSECLDSYHHLHYELRSLDATEVYDPLADIAPFKDVDRPTVGEARLCGDDAGFSDAASTPWSDCIDTAAGTCIAVSGVRDVVVPVSDLHLAGLSSASIWFTGQELGVHELRWRVCGERQPICAWKAQSRPDPLSTTVGNQPPLMLYSLREGADGTAMASESDYCTHDTFWMIPTNVTSDGFMRSGGWDTTSTPDGFYTLEVEAEDYGGNVGRRLSTVCVDNTGTHEPKLLVPDCDADLGTEPSDCELGASSPKMAVRPAAAPHVSSVAVCARNVGSADLPATYEVTLRLRWKNVGYLTTLDRSAEAERVFSSGGVAEITRTVDDLAPGGSWAPGEERCVARTVDLSGVPADDSPITAVVLEAAVSAGTDVPNDRNDVREDNNRAEIRLSTAVPGEVRSLRRTDTK